MKDLLTTRDVSKLTGWSQDKIRQLIELGRLPAINSTTGSRPRWVVRRSDLEAFLTPQSKGNSSNVGSERPIGDWVAESLRTKGITREVTP